MNRSWDKTPRTLTIHSDSPDICTLWRCWNPSIELVARGYISDYTNYSNLNQFDAVLRYGRYTTLVTPRMCFDDEPAEEAWFAFIDTLRPKVKWVIDTDDDLWSPSLIDRLVATQPWPNPEEVWQKLDYQRRSRIRLLERCDGVTVASPTLVELAKQYTKAPVYLVPNGIHAGQYTNNTPRVINHLTIGWSGGPRLASDLDPLYEVWPKLAQLRPDVHFVMQGWVAPKMAAIMPVGRFHATGGLELSEYTEYLRNIDIFCCPAPNDSFCLAKTPIKWFEATLAGAACVVSPYLYGPVINPPYTALIAETADEWLQALMAMVDDQQLRRTIHDAARETVLAKHTLRSTYSKWIDAWASFLE